METAQHGQAQVQDTPAQLPGPSGESAQQSTQKTKHLTLVSVPQVRAHTANTMADGEDGIDLNAMIPGPVRASMRHLAKSMLAAGDTTCVKVRAQEMIQWP